jgi:hypothetical protein
VKKKKEKEEIINCFPGPPQPGCSCRAVRSPRGDLTGWRDEQAGETTADKAGTTEGMLCTHLRAYGVVGKTRCPVTARSATLEACDHHRIVPCILFNSTQLPYRHVAMPRQQEGVLYICNISHTVYSEVATRTRGKSRKGMANRTSPTTTTTTTMMMMMNPPPFFF